VVLSLTLAACGGRESESEDKGSESASVKGPVDTSKCPGGAMTQGVTESEIKFGTSVAQSGPLAAVGAEYLGQQAALDAINAEGGVQGRKINLTAKDDAFQPARTVKNVSEFLEQDKVFGIVGLVGTPGTLAVADRMDQQCVPNLLVVTGNEAVVAHPWTTTAQQANAIEPHVELEGIKQVMKDPKLGLLTQNDDLGKGFVAAWENAVESGGATIAAKETYENTDTTLTSQVTSLAGKGADVLYFAGSGGPLCAQAMDAAAGKFKAVLLTGGCAVKPLLGLAKPASQENVYTIVAYKDPGDPKYKDDADVQKYVEQVKKVKGADPTSAITSQGYTIGTVLAEILNKAPELDRGAVINTAKTIELDSPGMLLEGINFKVSEDDPYPVESFEFVKWNGQDKLFETQGELITKFEGQSQTLGK
jgi:branched-chain amino acid transport system substrate-binding protein